MTVDAQERWLEGRTVPAATPEEFDEFENELLILLDQGCGVRVVGLPSTYSVSIADRVNGGTITNEGDCVTVVSEDGTEQPWEKIGVIVGLDRSEDDLILGLEIPDEGRRINFPASTLSFLDLVDYGN